MVKRLGTLLFLLVGLLLAGCGDLATTTNNGANNPTVPAPTSNVTTSVIATPTALTATTPATSAASATTALPVTTLASVSTPATTLANVTSTAPATTLARPTSDISHITAVTAPIVKPTTTPAPINTPGKLGKPVTQNGHILTVTKVERAKAFDGDKVDLYTGESHTMTSGHYEAYAGAEFVMVELNLEAGSEIEVSSSVNQPMATLKDSKNFLYRMLETGRTPDFGRSITLSKGDKTKGWLTFQVPEGVKGLVMELRLGDEDFSRSQISVFHIALDDIPTDQPSISQPVGANGKMGETVGQGAYRLTVSKMEVADEIQAEITHSALWGTRTAGDGNQFVSLELTFENGGDQDIAIDSYTGSLKDGEGYKYNASDGPSPQLFSFSHLPKGGKVKGWVAFKVPKTAKSFTFEYKIDDTPLRVMLGK